jgi:competence protein ComEC
MNSKGFSCSKDNQIKFILVIFSQSFNKQRTMRNPLAKVLMILVAGILISYSLNLGVKDLLITQLCLFSIIAGLHFSKIRSKNFLLTSLISLSVLIIGAALFKWNQGTLNSSISNDKSYGVQVFKGTVFNNPVNKTSTRLYIDIESLYLNDHLVKHVSGRFYLNVKNIDKTFNYKDEIIFRTNVLPIKNQGNPGEFDFKNYMNKKGILFQGYAMSEDVAIIGNSSNWFISLALRVRLKMLAAIDEYFPKKDAPIAKALLVGYKSDIDTETKSHYASAGASHILAVSGMHVGIIMLIISKINSIWARTARTKKIATMVLLVLLWFYVFLTGFSPSILRAGLMFSLVLVGRLIDRDHSNLNLLSASAVILLVYDPYYLFDLGFQLSYLAVGGIFFIYPKLSVLYHSRFKVVNWLWELSIVSISAQIATLPLTIYYFHQFPNAFLLTNIVTTICATFILIFGLVFIVFQWIDFMAEWTSLVCGKIIEYMNVFVAWIDSFEYSVSKGIYLNELQLIVLFVISILFFIFNLKTKKQVAWFVSFIFMGTGLFFLASLTNQSKMDELVVFNTRNATMLNFSKSGVNYHYTTEIGDAYNTQKLNDYWSLSKNSRNVNISDSLKTTNYYTSNGVILFDELSLIIVNDKNSKLLKDYDFDYIIVNQKAWIPKEIKNKGHWIVTGRLSSKKRQFLLEKLRSKNLTYHETSDEGAFVLKL